MKDKQRAARRAQQKRIIDKAKRKYKEWWRLQDLSKEENHVASSKLANNMKNCSCWMCGNPRKFSQGRAELTQQELRSERNLREGLDEYFEQ